MNYQRPKTIFCDIDGTLVKHAKCSITSNPDYKLEILEGTIEKLEEWILKGYLVILTTGRMESMRLATEQQLSRLGIFYNKLIMDIGGGERVLINDLKPGKEITASCHNLERNKGISDINI